MKEGLKNNGRKMEGGWKKDGRGMEEGKDIRRKG